jgi:hypothetical protein
MAQLAHILPTRVDIVKVVGPTFMCSTLKTGLVVLVVVYLNSLGSGTIATKQSHGVRVLYNFTVGVVTAQASI